jgi:adenosylmethionine-8-amino-7-oxononanoate aminotransferase
VLVRPLGDAVAISPPLVATREQIAEAAAAIAEGLQAAGRERAAPGGEVAAGRP